MLAVTLVVSLCLSAARADDLPPPPPPPSLDELTARLTDPEHAVAGDVTEAPESRVSVVPASPGTAALPPARTTPRRVDPYPNLGMKFDLGVPQGLAASLLIRPIPSVRLWGGPTWNYVAWGGQVGASIAPWQWGITPSLSVEAGRYVSADLSWLARDGAEGAVPSELEPLLRDVAYSYASLLVGLELGNPRGFSVSLTAGLTHLRVVAHGTAGTEASPDGGAAGEAQVTFRDPELRATIPTTKLGLQYWF